MQNTSALWVSNYASTAKDSQSHGPLEQSFEFQGKALESAVSAVFFTDKSGTILWANPAFETLTGYSVEEAIGKTPGELLKSGRHNPAFFKALWETILSGKVWRGEVINRRKDGTLYVQEQAIIPVQSSSQTITHFIAIQHNVSRKRRLEEEREIILEIIQGAHQTINLDEFFKMVHRSLRRIIYAENFFIALYNKAQDIFEYPFFVDQFDPPPPPMKPGLTRTAYVFRTGQPILMTEPVFRQLESLGEVAQVGTHCPAWLGVPLKTPNKTIGVLVVQSYEDENAFDERDVEFLASVGSQIALVIEHKRMEEALLISEKRFFQAFNSNPCPMTINSFEGSRYLAVNEAFLETMGFTREEVIGKARSEMGLWVEQEQRAQVEEAISTHGAVRNAEVKLKRKDGSLRMGLFSAETITLDRERYVLSVMNDITELKSAEAESTLQTTRFKQLFENSPVGIVMVNAQGEVVDANQSFEKMFQYSLQEIQGKNLDDVVAPEFLREEANALFSEAIKGRSIGKESVRRRKDGTLIPVQIYGVPVNVDKANLGGYGIYVDLTEREQMADRLRQGQKMEAIGQLAGGVAHDFNNLLTAILGYGQLMYLHLPPDSPLRSHAEEVIKAGERASSLTQQLLAFSRKQVLQPEVMDLNVVVLDMEKMFRRLIGENIELVTSFGPGLHKIKADPGQITQILMNLVINARDAMPGGGKLTIETVNQEIDKSSPHRLGGLPAGSYVRLAVRDTGCGMDKETQSHLFEPFFTTKQDGRGTGLGLSTVYGIVKQSGGDILVSSEVGRGTDFHVYLPAYLELGDQIGSQLATAKSDLGHETILLVEDESGVRGLIREILQTQGYRVLEAAHGNEALEIFQLPNQHIDLVITDMVMPQMGGRELVERISEIEPGIKVLLISGYSDDAFLHQGPLKLDPPFLQKPFSPSALASRVRELLDH